MDADLTGQLVVVAGGAGRVGGGVVRAALDAGAQVVVPVRPEDDLSHLPEHDRLRVEPADVSDPAAVAALAERLGAVDHVFASVGAWWQGARIPGIDVAEWDAVLASRLRPHLVLMSGLLPVVRGSYTVVAGDTLERPVAGAAPTSVVAAAVLGLARAADKDVEDVRVRAIILSALDETRTPETVGAAWLGLVGDPEGPVELRV
jgi:3-oxoacyl-[acyl-carrier protein] reductase